MKRRKIDYHEFDAPDFGELPETSGVASATELTGVMYRTPVTGEEWENLQELSPMEIPRRELKDTVAEKLHRAGTPEEAGKAVEEAGAAQKDGSKPPRRK